MWGLTGNGSALAGYLGLVGVWLRFDFGILESGGLLEQGWMRGGAGHGGVFLAYPLHRAAVKRVGQAIAVVVERALGMMVAPLLLKLLYEYDQISNPFSQL